MTPSNAKDDAVEAVARQMEAIRAVGLPGANTFTAWQVERGLFAAIEAMRAAQPVEAVKIADALVKLERAATVVMKYGANPGRQWLGLSGALITARAAIEAMRAARD